MQFGAPFLGAFAARDPAAIRDYAQAAEDLGYSHLFADEILLSDDPNAVYHETLTLFSFLAAVTSKIKFVTGVMILPKRSTLLVARQAAEVDFLSGGRLRLGVGVGWNQKEFQALGIDFTTRGKRIEEQIELLRKLWLQPRVSFHGEYHHFEDTGIHLPPVQRPIPIWIGGTAEIVLRRAARMADGWIADEAVSDRLQEIIAFIRAEMERQGRSADRFRFVKYLRESVVPRAEWAARVAEWQAIGVTHIVLLPALSPDLPNSVDEHIRKLQIFRRAIGDARPGAAARMRPLL